MPTKITKIFDKSGATGDFANEAAMFSYINGLDLLSLDQDVYIGLIGSIECQQYSTFGPTTSDPTHRVTMGPASDSVNVNKIATTTLDYGSSGSEIQFIHGRAQKGRPGLVFQNLRVYCFNNENGPAFVADGHNATLDVDIKFEKCRIKDVSSLNASSMTANNNSSTLAWVNCLSINAGGTGIVLLSGYPNASAINTTFATQGAGAGASVACDAGPSSSGLVAIGFGNNVFGGRSVPNSFANTSQATSGYTVVTGAGALVVNETNDYSLSANSPAIGAGADITKGTLDILSNNRGQTPDAGAKQRTPAVNLPTATITSITTAVTSGNKRRVTISGTTTGNPSSGLASITPTSTPGNNAVAQNNVALTFGSGTFSAVFSDDTRVGRYTETVTVTNSGGTGNATGVQTFDVIGASGVITSQPAPNGQKQSVSGTTSGTPESGLITWPADTAAADATTQGPFALTLGTNTFSDIDRVLPPGTYLAPLVTFTIPAGTSLPATGGSAVKIIGISGNPQAPEPDASGATVTSVSISPQTPTIAGAGTQAFTATVTGTNSPPQTVTWAATIGSINSSGVLTAPATMSSAQTGTVTATSTVDPTKSGSTTFTVPAGTVTPVVTGVSVSPSSATVTGGATQSFTATVSGTGSPSQGVTWSKVSGVGTVSSSGVYTAPAGTQAVQNAVIKATSTQDGSFSGNASITIPANSSSFVAKITVPLGSAAANLTGLKWAWHDQPTPDLFVGPPTDKGAAETADSAGTVVILLPNSTKTASGQIGHIEIMNSDGTTTTPYSGFVGPWAVD